ncbi:MAG: alpha-hydroxy acid oxidase, partial [Geminicoccaceae bacterium]|nr:alpha-hydroxy acid oxidase [Geminicoccaceae bacterium]
AGYEALVLTTDNQVLGQRERDLRNGFTIPPRLTWRSGVDLVRCLPWLKRMANARGMTFANYPGAGNDILSLGKHMAELLDPAASWTDVEWLRSVWQGPLILKGVLHPDEARRAADCGVDGVIVSNHGGRQLDGAISSLDALPDVVEAAGDRLTVMLDGGMRRGSHVVKALALGARACLIGRPHLFGLAVAGQAGVARVLEIYRSEIERVMGLGGWDGIGRLDPSILAHPAWRTPASARLAPLRDAAD